MAWKRPPKDASDQLLAEEFHLYKTAPGRKPAISVTKVTGMLTDGSILAQAKAKQTADIAVHEAAQRVSRIVVHKAALTEKYDNYQPWQIKKYELVDLTDDDAVYFDWLRMEVERRWKAKADLGSRVHGHVYTLSTGEDIDALDDELPFVDAWGKYVEENGVEFIQDATERVIVHPAPEDNESLEYGGRDDLFAVHHAGECQGLILGDFKTGGFYPTQLTLQLSGYGFGKGFATYDKDGNLLDDYDPIPAWTRGIGIYLHDDGTYELHEMPSDEDAWSVFLRLRSVLNFKAKMQPYEKEAEALWKQSKAK